MANVTSSPIGTAYVAHLDGVDFAGKTGTAQVMGHDALARTGKGHNTLPNAWFVGMTPRRNPDIVVAVLWEHGNWGNNSAQARLPDHQRLRHPATRQSQQPPR